jgi:hypothetical protein
MGLSGECFRRRACLALYAGAVLSPPNALYLTITIAQAPTPVPGAQAFYHDSDMFS